MIEPSRSRAELERGMRLGWHTGAQLYGSLRGEAVADLAVGEARPGVAMATGPIVEWASATKPVTCSAAALLWQRGLFDLDDPVCRYLPEFAENGKELVTVRHLLTHTFVAVRALSSLPWLANWAATRTDNGWTRMVLDARVRYLRRHVDGGAPH